MTSLLVFVMAAPLAALAAAKTASDPSSAKGAASVVQVAERSGGGDVSGGGSDCHRPDLAAKPFLTDFAPFILHPSILHMLQTPGIIVPVDERVREMGYRPLKMDQFPVAKLLKQKLEAWRTTNNANVIDAIESATDAVDFYGTAYTIKLKPDPLTKIQKICSAEQIQTLALYNDSQVVIALPEFNQLDLYSQMGLLLHESLRLIQIGHDHNYHQEREAELRDLVAHLILFDPHQPNPDFLLEEHLPFFFPDFKTKVKNLARLRTEICQELHTLSTSEIEEMNQAAGAASKYDCRRDSRGLPDINAPMSMEEAACLSYWGRLPQETQSLLSKQQTNQLLDFAFNLRPPLSNPREFWKNLGIHSCIPVNDYSEVDEENGLDMQGFLYLLTVISGLESREIAVIQGRPFVNSTHLQKKLEALSRRLSIASRLTGNLTLDHVWAGASDAVRELGNSTKKMQNGWYLLNDAIDEYFDGKLPEAHRPKVEKALHLLFGILNESFKSMLDQNLIADPGVQMDKILNHLPRSVTPVEKTSTPH